MLDRGAPNVCLSLKETWFIGCFAHGKGRLDCRVAIELEIDAQTGVNETNDVHFELKPRVNCTHDQLLDVRMTGRLNTIPALR